MKRLMNDQPPEVVELLDISAATLADGVHTIVVRDPMWGYWNKALGFCETVDDATIGKAVSRARDREVPAFAFQVQPRAVPDDSANARWATARFSRGRMSSSPVSDARSATDATSNAAASWVAGLRPRSSPM